jgi:hypothetical protein
VHTFYLTKAAKQDETNSLYAVIDCAARDHDSIVQMLLLVIAVAVGARSIARSTSSSVSSSNTL